MPFDVFVPNKPSISRSQMSDEEVFDAFGLLVSGGCCLHNVCSAFNVHIAGCSSEDPVIVDGVELTGTSAVSKSDRRIRTETRDTHLSLSVAGPITPAHLVLCGELMLRYQPAGDIAA